MLVGSSLFLALGQKFADQPVFLSFISLFQEVAGVGGLRASLWKGGGGAS